MNKALLDTDIFSEILKGKNAAVRTRSIDYRRAFGHYTIAAPSVAEIVRGFTQRSQSRQLASFRQSLPQVEVLSLGAQEADLAGEITGKLTQHGTPIGVIDPMIAAVAIVNELTLVTGNTQHFEKIVALGYPLALANWRIA